ncbi:hypothetical protein COO91_01830 [Nostoc flagelliforme CCNUN1]|uniref:Uncharacterized protein n=1 Tax=Nostoc flagelliforme CCNUN1 TaxID=2038116 RepID=A0A2K8SKJ3_9NOSO|nr:hypothetical protein COO91_01830 [Nostoc flagelliforme CCNUN1]
MYLGGNFQHTSTKYGNRMALRKEKIVEAAGVQRSGGAGEKEEVLGIAFGYLEIPLCTPAPLPLCNPYAAYSSA